MSNQHDSQINELIQLLELTFTSPDKKLREDAEKRLSNLESNFIEYFHLLLRTITENNNVKHEIKWSIVLYIKRLTRKYWMVFPLELADKALVIQHIITAMTTPKMSEQFQKNMKEILEELINSLNGSSDAVVELSNMIIANMKGMSVESLSGLTKIMSTIIMSSQWNSSNFQPILLNIIEFGKKSLELLNSSPCGDTNDLLGELFHTLSRSTAKIEKRLNIDKHLKAEAISLFNIFLPIGVKLLFNISENNNTIISWTGIRATDTSINKSKYQIIKFIISTISSMPTFIVDTEMIQIHNEIIKSFLQNLEYIINNKMDYVDNLGRSTETYQDNKYSVFIAYIFKYLSKIWSKKTFQVHFGSLQNSIVEKIILPFLKITNSEIAVASGKDFGDYVKDLNDVIYTNKNKTIKSSASLWLKWLYLNMKNSSSKDRPLVAWAVKLLMSNIETDVDLSWLWWCIMSDWDDNSEEDIEETHLNEVKSAFLARKGAWFQEATPFYIKHKLCVFMNCYINKLYTPINTEYSNLLKFLFSNLLQKEDKLLSSEASHVINHVLSFNKQNESLYLAPVINEFMIHIIDYIASNRNAAFFDLIMEILVSVGATDHDSELFKVCVRSIVVEVDRHSRLKFKVTKMNKSKVDDYQIIINKIFNVVRVLISNKTFVWNNVPLIEEALVTLLPYMSNPVKIEFDEDIVLIVTKLIQHIQSVPNFAYDLLLVLYKYCDKCCGMALDWYELINWYIIYGSNAIEADAKLSGAMLSIFNSGLNESVHRKSGFYVCCLFQIWVMNSKTIPEQTIVSITNIAIEKLSYYYSYSMTPETKIMFEKVKYNYIGYLTLVFSCCINYPNIVLRELTRANKEHQWINWTQVACDSIDIFSHYQVKILVISICSLALSEAFKEENGKLLNMVFRFLVLQKNTQSKKLTKVLKKEIHCNFVPEDEEDEDDDDEGNAGKNKNEDEDVEDNIYTDEGEIKDWIKRTVNPMKEEDEYKIFKSTMTQLQARGAENVIWANNLSDVDRIQLNNILNTTIITVTNKEKNYNIPRRIVMLKRNKSAFE